MESLPREESTDVLDEQWYSRFHEEYFEDYEKLVGDGDSRAVEKEAFLTGVTDNPDLDYPLLEIQDFEGKEDSLLQLKHEILDQEPNEVVKKIYRTKVNELLATVRMLRAASVGDDRKFSRYSNFIYGTPSSENINYILASIKDKLSTTKDGESEFKIEARNSLSKFIEASSIDPIPSSMEIRPNVAGEAVFGNVEGSEEVVSIFEETLSELGLTDWVVVVDKQTGVSNLSTSQERKEIVIPGDEQIKNRQISKKKLQGLIEHEIKTHALRRFNGERSKLKLLGLGLDRYIKGEEGIATYAEQQIVGTKEFAGIPKYFAIAIAKGLSGIPRDFRQTFEVMKDYYAVTLKDGEDLDNRAKNAAYNDCVRIFRGTTCKTPGAVFTRDLAYFSGNKDVWHLVNNDTDVVKTFSVGKFDPTNDEHIYLLEQLGILDSDLEDLEK